MLETRLAVTLSCFAILYTLVPMLINASGAAPWIAMPPGVTFVVYQAAAFACAAWGLRTLRERKLVQSFAIFAAAVFWAMLIYVVVAYCPAGT